MDPAPPLFLKGIPMGETRINISHEYKLHKVVPEYSHAGNLEHVCIERQGDHHRAIATDGKMIACLPFVDVEGDLWTERALIPGKVVEQANREDEAIHRSEDGEFIVACGDHSKVYPQPKPDKPYPNVNEVLSLNYGSGDNVVAIGLNVNALAALAEAIGAVEGAIELRVKVENQRTRTPYRVTACNRSGPGSAFGLLMPILISPESTFSPESTKEG